MNVASVTNLLFPFSSFSFLSYLHQFCCIGRTVSEDAVLFCSLVTLQIFAHGAEGEKEQKERLSRNPSDGGFNEYCAWTT